MCVLQKDHPIKRKDRENVFLSFGQRIRHYPFSCSESKDLQLHQPGEIQVQPCKTKS